MSEVPSRARQSKTRNLMTDCWPGCGPRLVLRRGLFGRGIFEFARLIFMVRKVKLGYVIVVVLTVDQIDNVTPVVVRRPHKISYSIGLLADVVVSFLQLREVRSGERNGLGTRKFVIRSLQQLLHFVFEIHFGGRRRPIFLGRWLRECCGRSEGHLGLAAVPYWSCMCHQSRQSLEPVYAT